MPSRLYSRREVDLAVAVQVGDGDEAGRLAGGISRWCLERPVAVAEEHRRRRWNPRFAVTRSILRSPFKSKAAMKRGPSPDGNRNDAERPIAVSQENRDVVEV